jgi:hypothetical protein
VVRGSPVGSGAVGRGSVAGAKPSDELGQ